MTAAVIIPTYNGAGRITRTLQALSEQSHLDFELIVVNDGSTDETVQVITAMEMFPKPIVISQTNKGRAGARNAGLRSTSAELLIFFDDDMVPEKDAVLKHMVHHEAYPMTALTAIQQANPAEANTDFLQFTAFRNEQWMKRLGKELKLMNASNLFFTSAHCSMPAKLLHAVGGFDESMTDAEDFELATRILESGYHVYFSPEIRAWHEDGLTMEKYILRQRQYLAAWKSLAAKKPHLIRNYNRFSLRSPKGIKKMFFKALAQPQLVSAVDNEQLRFLPKKLRYQLYEYIIASLGRYNSNTELITNAR
ncbi:MAG: glycosyltransferase [Cryomorphaceae bacterium]|nr:MAG: glycosyltransferase [Cryomorphaceae bacterium]